MAEEKKKGKPPEEKKVPMDKEEEIIKEEKIGPEMQIVVFKLGEEEFAADIMEVREITRYGSITQVPGAPDFIEGVINLRGDVIAVMDLNKRIELEHTQKGEKTRIVIAEVKDMVMGMIVDSVTEVLKLHEKNIDAAPSIVTDKIHESYISGVGKIGKRLLIILNLKNVLSGDEAAQVDEAKKKHMEQIKKKKK